MLTDGILAFDGGINPAKIPLVRSTRAAFGLAPNQLSNAVNCVFRDGGASPRPALRFIARIGHVDGGAFAGATMYYPDIGMPQLIFVQGGHVKSLNIGNGEVTDLSEGGATLPAETAHAYFCQAEKWLIIQAGDYVTLPLFYDGATLRQSIGIQTNSPRQEPNQNEIPAAGPMCYHMGRVWYAIGRKYFAGDIVGGPSGTAEEGFRDSVLSVTEAPLCFGGDGFIVPAGAGGGITALTYSHELNTQLGQGKLFVFTPRLVCALSVPVQRSAWVELTRDNVPIQIVIHPRQGSISPNAIVQTNGDLMYYSTDGALRSIILAVRSFEEWADYDLSLPVRTFLTAIPGDLRRFVSAAIFDNRLYLTIEPELVPVGVVFRGLAVLDFYPSTEVLARTDPAWNGFWSGLGVIQLVEDQMTGRLFAVVWNENDECIEVYLVDPTQQRDAVAVGAAIEDHPIWWEAETPAFQFEHPLVPKRLIGGQLMFDRIYGSIDVWVWWRADGDPCWHEWYAATDCFPTGAAYGPGDIPRLVLPQPPVVKAPGREAPAHIGLAFQVKVRVRGWCRLRGVILHTEPFEKHVWQL